MNRDLLKVFIITVNFLIREAIETNLEKENVCNDITQCAIDSRLRLKLGKTEKQKQK